MSIARNGQIELGYDVDGSGPDLLLIVGTATTRPLWALVRPQLAESFRTIAFDNRDTGESTPANAPYTLCDLAADAAAVLDAAGVQRAHILGHSMGGAIAQEFALTYPERCASLTIVCSWARGDGYTKNLMKLMSALSEGVRDDRTLLATILYMGTGISTLREIDLFDKTDEAMALAPLMSREALVRQWQLDLTVDTADRLSKLAMPVHVIWGGEDRLLPQPLSQRLIDAIPSATGTCIEGCGHVPMVDAPEAFIEAVHSFLCLQSNALNLDSTEAATRQCAS
jgi:pimeloyl-ACP methyl ester carboxylesterase